MSTLSAHIACCLATESASGYNNGTLSGAFNMSEIEDIKASTMVKDIVENFPELTDFFLDLGICGCGYRWESDYYWTIERVAREKGLNLEALLEDLNKKIND